MYSLYWKSRRHAGRHFCIHSRSVCSRVITASNLISDQRGTRPSGIRVRCIHQRLRLSSSAVCATAESLIQPRFHDTTNNDDNNDNAARVLSGNTSRIVKTDENGNGDLIRSRGRNFRAGIVSPNGHQSIKPQPAQSPQSSQKEVDGSESTDPYLNLTSNEEPVGVDADAGNHSRTQQYTDSTIESEYQSSFFAVPEIKRNVLSQSDILDPLAITSTRPKIDLSYHNVRVREAAASVGGKATALYSQTTDFRSKLGMRRIVAAYMQHIEDLVTISPSTAMLDEKTDHQLLRVFTPETMTFLRDQGYEVEDVMSLSWIFSADNISLSIRRYAILSQKRRQHGCLPMPIFVPLQLLRASSIDTYSLNLLIDEIRSDLDVECRWDQDSGPVLLIRLLRSARKVEVSLFENIVDLAPRVVPFALGKHANADAERLTHFYNRLLSLLALPISRHPYLSAIIQQRAQLKIVKLIMQSGLPVSLNREGYRALTKIQLLHKKTVEEQEWSSVKAPSWPPWRRDDLGIDSRNEYPGRYSRVSKVLKRFLEAGYSPESAEKEAQILAGWDIDKSPTIQVRRIVKRQPLSWIKNVFKGDNKERPLTDHNVWAARVAATRSIREAWVCFYSYMDVTENQKRDLKVYYEMFFKLFARTQQSDQRLVPSPGDGREVFADPLSPRDLVYVPKEPPSLDELYAQMLQDGLRPTGRLLAGLVSNANTLKEALDYIEGSSLDDVKKDVLLHPENYPGNAIRHTYSRIPDYLLTSYIGILTRQISHDGVKLYEPGSRSLDEPIILTRGECRPLQYALTLFKIWKPTYLPAYHAVIHGLYTHSKAKETTIGSSNFPKPSLAELWKTGKFTLDMLERQGLEPDLECFRKVVMLVRSLIIRAPRRVQDTRINISEMVKVPISIFTQAVWKRKSGIQALPPGKAIKIGSQPYWKDIENLLLMLGLNQDFPSITEVLRWMSDEQEHLAFVDGGGYKMQRLMCAARVALEGIWAPQKSRSASQEQINQAVKYAERWGWPEDVDVEEFLQQHWTWLKSAAKHL